MTDEQYEALWDSLWGYHGREPMKLSHLEFARAIESAACAQLQERIAALEKQLAYADDAAKKGDDARAAAGGMEMRIAELEAERDQVRGLFNKSKDEFHTARQESSLRWQMICDLTNQRDALEAKLAQRVLDGWAPSNAWQIFGMDGDLLFIQHDEASANRYKTAGHRVEQLFVLAAAPAAPEQQEPTKWTPEQKDRLRTALGEVFGFDGTQAPNAQQAKRDAEFTQALEERDTAQGWADGLAGLIGTYFGQDIGEHSSSHCPWQEAKYIIQEAAPYVDTAQQAGAQPVAQEPVLCVAARDLEKLLRHPSADKSIKAWLPPAFKSSEVPLYTAQPKAVPLTDEQIEDFCMAIGFTSWYEWDGGFFQAMWTRLVRAVEAHYGIGAPEEKGG